MRILKTVLMSLMLVIMLSGGSMAAVGTCTAAAIVPIRDYITNEVDKYELTYTCTASSTDATYPATTISAENKAKLQGYYLYRAETKPGTPTAPTDLYDITIKVDGIDVVGGLLADRSISATQLVDLSPSSGYFMVGTGDLIITPTNNSVNSAVFYLTLEFVKAPPEVLPNCSVKLLDATANVYAGNGTLCYFLVIPQSANTCVAAVYDSATTTTTEQIDYAGADAGTVEAKGNTKDKRFKTGIYVTLTGTGCKVIVGRR